MAAGGRGDHRARHYALSLGAAGCASLLFHSSWGAWRPFFRKLDYFAIAACTTTLLWASRPKRLPLVPLSLLSAALAPVSPLSVIAVNGVLLEGMLTVRASRRPRLRPLQLLHSAAAAVGGAAWLADDIFDLPFAHSVRGD